MREKKETDQRFSWDDIQRILLLPLLVSGGGLGLYGSNILTERLDAEIQARKDAEIRISKLITDVHRAAEKHADTEGHSVISQQVAILKEKVARLEKKID